MIKIYNAIGDLVFKDLVNFTNSSFNIEHLPNGVYYYYDISVKDMIIKSDKIVVIK